MECSNVCYGCDMTKIPLDFVEIHEKFECEYRIVKCGRPGCLLRQPLPYKLYQIHSEFECQGVGDSIRIESIDPDELGHFRQRLMN
mmetsp:Transcript_35173/g.53905  ORF Transcript_35173/g.53905 Transcript_35173/m.53905 type:complete len:86 (-) Transcript_35173:1644-1901(-)